MARMFCRTPHTSSAYRPGHTADTIPGIHLITVTPTPTIQQTTTVDPTTTMVDPITTTVDPTVMTDDPAAMTGDPIVTIVGTGMIGRIGTGHIETTGHTATIVDATGTTILTIARGAGLAIVLDTTAVVGIMTTWKITRAASPRSSCLITVVAGEFTYVLWP